VADRGAFFSWKFKLLSGRISLKEGGADAIMPPGTDEENLGDPSTTRVSRIAVVRDAQATLSTLNQPVSRAAAQDDPTAFPVEGWDRYEVVSFLGAGGMGRVFKARDPRLDRHVALKLIHGHDPVMVQRFFQEARSQARVEHPHVCKVYEVGEVEGHPYIAMQYVDGESLKDAARQMSLDQKVSVMKDVAEGLHAAHRLGLIHRDIKPTNIMLERDEGGTLHPYVLDFGLARRIDVGGPTPSSVIEGTPSYMSPEQAEGDLRFLDRRTDVYGLGATLYSIVRGKPPFVGATGAEILGRRHSEEVESLRGIDRAIPVDLDSIVMKCLKRRPEQRYESARALAEDLERFLDGEPIQARRATLRYLALNKARKHKALVAVSTTALVAILVLLGMGLRAEIAAKKQARIAEQLGQDVKGLEQFLRYAYTLPLHDVEREKAVIRRRMRGFEVAKARLGELGEGPGEYALGRGHLALHEYEAAREHLERARAHGYVTTEVAYSLGQALGELYRQELDVAQRIGDDRAREARKKWAEREYLEPALRRLRESSAADAESKTFVEALTALYEKRYEEAAAKAQQASAEAPWLYETRKLEGDARYAQGNDKKAAGDREAALVEYRRAVDAYQSAAEMARSDAAVHEAEAEVWIQMMEVEQQRGLSPQRAYEGAIAAVDRALGADPRSGSAHGKKAWAHWRWGAYATARGEDPTATLNKAIASANEAIRANPADAVALEFMGLSHLLIGVHDSNRGVPALQSMEQGIGYLKCATEANPSFAWAWNDLGAAYLMEAYYLRSQGIDDRAQIERSLESLHQAIRSDPSYYVPHANLGDMYATQAEHDLRHGIDPTPSVDSGVAECQKGMAIDPTNDMAYLNLGASRVNQAIYQLSIGASPQVALDDAVDRLNSALRLNPAAPETLQKLSAAHRTMALHRIEQATDATSALELSRTAARTAIELAPDDWHGHLMLGELELVAARSMAQSGADRQRALDEAEASLRLALHHNAARADIYRALAELALRRAEGRAAGKEAPRDEVATGFASAEMALSINPQMPEVIALEGALHLIRARSESAVPARIAAAKRAQALLAQAMGDNLFLRREYGPLLAEAAQLSAPAP
jgi:serine/threonine-protein kinase